MCKFQISSQGNNGLKELLNSDDKDGKFKKTISIKDSVRIYSFNFSNFINGDLVFFYFYSYRIKKQLLECAISWIPNNSSGGSSSSNLAMTRSSKNSTTSKTGKRKQSAIAEAAKVLGSQMQKSLVTSISLNNNK